MTLNPTNTNFIGRFPQPALLASPKPRKNLEIRAYIETLFGLPEILPSAHWDA